MFRECFYIPKLHLQLSLRDVTGSIFGENVKGIPEQMFKGDWSDDRESLCWSRRYLACLFHSTLNENVIFPAISHAAAVDPETKNHRRKKANIEMN